MRKRYVASCSQNANSLNDSAIFPFFLRFPTLFASAFPILPIPQPDQVQYQEKEMWMVSFFLYSLTSVEDTRQSAIGWGEGGVAE